ncbi:MAG: NUDIX domain-containing protein [Paenarthrobacter ureafaciens]|uniref:NUDIX hydrolase n=1 Tax=Paenarthrobacter ureafaciens TaxID=37931 RepID=UPI001AC4FC87|nr:NUDIX domain-containing protein [Paenarthrobacter ureafaciens]MBN9131512.1 NUDIX domain-containing protein [Paenarthrobacter ureafaciens]
MTEQPAKDTPVAEPRLAASVILLRDASAGLEAFVQHRVSSMDFAAGMVVFPGGRVDASDAEGWDYSSELLERHAADWAMSSIAASDAHAQAGTVLAAAIREVFEEAGLTLDASQLRPWANWVTPTDMPKRFDTYFYVARPAPGAEPQHQTTEAWQSLWMPVEGILAAEAEGKLQLMPPTYFLLKEISEFHSVEAVWQAEHQVRPVLSPPGSMAAFLKERGNKQ